MSKLVKTEPVVVAAAVISSDGGEKAEDDPKMMRSLLIKELVGNTSGSSSSKVAVVKRSCQADKCGSDLTVAKAYHRRHKVCEVHAKSQVVFVAGNRQRFCQQCSRFHEVSEFDESKRSCRRRLAGHNERRRKSQASATAIETSHQHQHHHQRHDHIDSSHKTGMVCARVDDNNGMFYSSVQDKHFDIR